MSFWRFHTPISYRSPHTLWLIQVKSAKSASILTLSDGLDSGLDSGMIDMNKTNSLRAPPARLSGKIHYISTFPVDESSHTD